MSSYSRDAIDEERMLTFVIDGVSHQAWYRGTWEGIRTRCGLVATVTSTNDMRLPRLQPITCMLCIDAIADAIAEYTNAVNLHSRSRR